MSTTSDDLRNERERLEIEKKRLELERERFAFEQQRSAASTTHPPSSPSKVSIPTSMWVIGVGMIVACFLPWISLRGSYDFGIAGRGSLVLGDASGTNFWQGQLCILLIIGALIAKHLQNRTAAGFCALGAPLLVVHFLLQAQGLFGYSQSWSFMGMTGSSSLKSDPSFGSIALLLLSIRFAIIAFRQPSIKGVDPIAPTATKRSLPEVPTIIVQMITTQVVLVILLATLFFFYKKPTFLPGATLLFAALHWGICRKQKWPTASFWSLIFLTTVAVNWIFLLVYRAFRHQNEETGNWPFHVAIEFSHAIVNASPYTYAVLGTLAIFFAWSEHLRWKLKSGELATAIPNRLNAALASMIVLAYPLTVTTIDATKLDIPTKAERQRAESIVQGLTSEPWTVFEISAPLNTSTFTISTQDRELTMTDYGEILVYANLLLDNGQEMSGQITFTTSDEQWSNTINPFTSGEEQVRLIPDKNGFIRVEVDRDRYSNRVSTTVKVACPSSTYLRRKKTVFSLEEILRSHSMFLSPQKQTVDLSSLSEDLKNEVRVLIHEGKAFNDFPPSVQKRIEAESQGAAIPTSAIGSEPVAIAKDVLLQQDTVGVAEYRYVSVPPLSWVGLTDSTIVIEHRLRLVAASRDGSGEIRSLRTYYSTFDTAGVLLTSTEINRIQEGITTSGSDSTYVVEGIFLSASCHESCHVNFRVLREGRTEEQQLLYMVENERIPLFLPTDGQGGAEDLTNPEMIGKRFLLTMKRTAVYSEEGGVGDQLPYWTEALVDIAPL